MPAPKRFLVRTRPNQDGSVTFYARFTDQYGRRQEFKLGRSPDWNLAAAEKELDYIRVDVERSTWSQRPVVVANPQTLTFREMAREWWDKKIVEQKAVATQAAYQAVVAKHLVPYFGSQPLASITPRDVDNFARQEYAKGLRASYVNSHIRLLGAILETAMDWYEGVLPRNPARGKARYIAEAKGQDPSRWLDADLVELLLYAARDLDTKAQRQDYRLIGRESVIACLAFTGMRSAEVCALTWNDVDWQQRLLYAPGTKTDAAVREINIVNGLLPYLLTRRSETRFDETGHRLWPTANGQPRDKDNLNRRVVQPVVARARALVAEDKARSEKGEPRLLDLILPDRISPHTFRRTFCGFATEVEKDPFYVQGQMGHTNPAFTQRVYNRVRSRSSAPDLRVSAWFSR